MSSTLIPARAPPHLACSISCFSLERDAAYVDLLRSWLSEAEVQRAAMMPSPVQGRRYVIARGTLRSLLAAKLGRLPTGVQFRYGRQGKPELDLGADGCTLHFNVAHSRDIGVIAVSERGPVGVDIEYAHGTARLDVIAARYYTVRERAILAALPFSDRRFAFFRTWTRKEAYLKGRGEGVSQHLMAVEVTARPGEPARLLEVAGLPGEPDRWHLADLSMPEGYVGAVAEQVA